LGASYDSTQSNVSFRVYSSRATQIEVDLYSLSPMGSPEALRRPP
jgi:isoamylase